MPVPNGLQTCISDSLSKSLAYNGKGKSADRKVSNTVTSSAKKALLEKATITFVKAEKDANSMLQNLKEKYVCLNPGSSSSSGLQNGYVHTKSEHGAKAKSDGFPTPKIVLYAPDKIKLTWEAPRKVGSGLANLGNTCFLNSVLQCLSYTAPLVRYLTSGQHKAQCRCNGFCMLCELQIHFNKCLTQHGGALKPLGVLQKLKMIAKHMRWGRQEDAHEFLRYVVDAMQKACLSGQSNSLEKLSKETTLVHQVFGGYLRSQVRCMQCKTTSDTYDPLLDISVDIKGVNSVEKALQRFVQPETLDVDNAYKCLRCKRKVRALKQFTIHRAPKVLTIHMKRFDYHRLMGGKISRHIDFSSDLNLRPYMSQRQGDPVSYQLYAVLVHSGFSCNSGHYYCYIKAPNHTWYCMNDSHVSQTGVNSVLSSEAYILFYTQLPPHKSAVGSAAHKVAQAMNGSPLMSKAHKSERSSKPPPVDKPVVLCPTIPAVAPRKPSTQSNNTVTPAKALSPLKLANPVSNDSMSSPQTGPRRLPLTTIDPQSTPDAPLLHKADPKVTPTSTDKPLKRTHEKSEAALDKTAGTQMKKRKVHNEPVKLEVNGHGKTESYKLMSPPRTPSMMNPIHKGAISTWQVTPTNGHLHSHSESETGSVNSTSSWTVSTTQKCNTTSSNSPPASLPNGVQKKKKKKKRNSIEFSTDGLRRKIYPPSVKSGRDEKDVGVCSKTAELSAPPTRQLKQLKSDLQLSNETTPEPLLPRKKKKKKRKAVELHSEVGSQKLNTAAETVAKRLTNNPSSAPDKLLHDTSSSKRVSNKKKKKKKKLLLLNGEGLNGVEVVGESECHSVPATNGNGHSAATTDRGSCESLHQNGVIDGMKRNDNLGTENEVVRRKDKKKRRFSEPVVRVWDASVDEDDVAFKRQDDAQSLSRWDGRKESNISFLMERHASGVKGLGSGVSTWDGDKSEINKEVEREKFTANYKNSWYDGYEQEIDEGKKKKVKVKTKAGKDNREHFQWIQNSTNRVRELKREGKLPSLPSYDY